MILPSLKLLGNNISGESSVKELKQGQICSQLYQLKSKFISDHSEEVSQLLTKIKEVHPAHLILLPVLSSLSCRHSLSSLSSEITKGNLASVKKTKHPSSPFLREQLWRPSPIFRNAISVVPEEHHGQAFHIHTISENGVKRQRAGIHHHHPQHCPRKSLLYSQGLLNDVHSKSQTQMTAQSLLFSSCFTIPPCTLHCLNSILFHCSPDLVSSNIYSHYLSSNKIIDYMSE